MNEVGNQLTTAGILKKLLLNIYYWPMFSLVTISGLMLLPLIVLFQAAFLGRTFGAGLRWSISLYGWVLTILVPFFAPVRVEYRGKKPPEPCILVANHSSIVDPYLFAPLFREFCFITSWPFGIPVYGPLMRLAGYVSSEGGWDNFCQRSSEMLKAGATMIIWPEGHRSRDGQLGRFKKGAFALSVETGYPVVPLCIIGSGKFLAPGKGVLSPSRIKLIVLDPIYPEAKGDRQQQITEMRDLAQQSILKTLEENSRG